MSEIPQWVRLACRRWGAQKRRIWSGEDWHGNVDGYASSFVGRLLEERDGAGQGQRKQHWLEVYFGDGLAVYRAIPGMPNGPSDALHVKYVWDPRAKLTWTQKAELLNVSERALYEAVGRAETWIHARLENPAQSQVIDESRKNSQSGLKVALKKAQTRVHLIKAPELSFAALHRSVLSLK